MVRDQYGERGDGLLTEERALGDFDGLAEATHREVHEAAVALLGGVEEVHEESYKDRVKVKEVSQHRARGTRCLRVLRGPLAQRR